MSAVRKIIEGTWEEVASHAHEFAGHRLKVLVIDDAQTPFDHPAFDTSPAAVTKWSEQLRLRALSRPAIHLGDDSRDAIYEDYLK